MKFYESCPVLAARRRTCGFRACVVRSHRPRFRVGLDLLGIRVVERM